MLAIFENFFVQVVFVFGFVILCGMFISVCNRCFYAACGDAAFPVVRLTGYIGTPIHEFSHYLMCLLFGHTVTDMKLINGAKRSKTLGYVEHTYYKTNLYHQAGNYFIGISPILAGGMTVLFFMWLLVPNVFFEMARYMGGAFDASGFGERLKGMARALFNGQTFSDLHFWICLALSFMVVIHMEISRSDIRSGARGLLVLSALMLIADVVLGLMFPEALKVFTSACVKIGIFSGFFLLLPSAFAGGIGFVSLCVLAAKAMLRGRPRTVAVNHHRVGSTRARKK